MEAELDAILHVLVSLFEHLQVVFRAKVAHARFQKMQIMLQGELADAASLRAEHLRGSTVAHVDRIDVFDETHDLGGADVLAEPAAELRREVVLAVGKSARAAEAAHDAARLAADAALDLARRNRTAAMVYVVAALQDDDGKAGLLLRQLVCRENARRTRAHDGDIVFFHLAASHPLTLLQLVLYRKNFLYARDSLHKEHAQLAAVLFRPFPAAVSSKRHAVHISSRPCRSLTDPFVPLGLTSWIFMVS